MNLGEPGGGRFVRLGAGFPPVVAKCPVLEDSSVEWAARLTPSAPSTRLLETILSGGSSAPSNVSHPVESRNVLLLTRTLPGVAPAAKFTPTPTPFTKTLSFTETS